MLNVIYTIPSLALLAILVAIFGLGTPTAIVALVAYAQMILVRNVAEGLRGVSPAALDAADGLGFTPGSACCASRLPLALPAIVGGIRIATVSLIGIATIAAWIDAGGLGRARLRGLAPGQSRQDRRRQPGRRRARAGRRRRAAAAPNAGAVARRERAVRVRHAARCRIPARAVRPTPYRPVPPRCPGWVAVVAESGYLTVVRAPGESVRGDLIALDDAALALADGWEEVPLYERLRLEARRQRRRPRWTASSTFGPTASRERPARGGVRAPRPRARVLAEIRAFRAGAGERSDQVRTKSESA